MVSADAAVIPKPLTDSSKAAAIPLRTSDTTYLISVWQGCPGRILD
jgi:hypothetical protein